MPTAKKSTKKKPARAPSPPVPVVATAERAGQDCAGEYYSVTVQLVGLRINGQEIAAESAAGAIAAMIAAKLHRRVHRQPSQNGNGHADL